MKVTIKTCRLIQFKDLPESAEFMWNFELFKKLIKHDSDKLSECGLPFKAIIVKTGQLCNFNTDDLVEPVSVEAIVRPIGAGEY